MRKEEVNELRAAGAVIDKDTPAGLVVKVNRDGAVIVTAYGDTRELGRIYQSIAGAWCDFGACIGRYRIVEA